MANSEHAAQPAQVQPSLSPRFENGKAMIIAGLRGHFTFSDWQGIPAQWTNFMSRGHLPTETGDAHYGLCFGSANGFDYLSGVEVSSLEGLPTDLQHSNLPAQRYAVFTHSEHVSQLRKTLDAIWRKWLPSSGNEAVRGTNGAPDFFERYGKNFNPQTGMGDIEVWLPVKS